MLGSHVPDLRALELLVVVASTGSLSAAAAELGITQQAASSRIRTAETLVGAPLLTRTRRGSALTQTGDLVVHWATRVVDAAEQLDAGIAALRQDRRAQLRIAASLTVAEYLLPGWLVAFRAHQATIGLALTEFTMTATNSERVVELVASEAADLGFVEGPEPPSGLRHRLIGVDELVVVVGPSHPWAQRSSRRVTAATLASTPMVVREAGSGTRTVLERALRDLPVSPPALELASTAAVRAAVAAGAGPAALSEYAVRDDIASGRLTPISVTGLDLSRRLHAVWTRGANPPAGPARDLVQWAVAQAHSVRGRP
ncbi:LysR family transcriptional regulator [Nocardioides eburneiflavus]|uniref:LysR family transcriptional regulator n=1 Tax=Nocardioides eburneiflavus TaxID=2518372 RepID=A0A4Z1BR69_9ACTN|nr:LysR family transcriptional regulator [Nocardioides eburneiflavus]TGN63811.1 LysR family transcriptional regulator [Nocardioides eburneiflavus]